MALHCCRFVENLPAHGPAPSAAMEDRHVRRQRHLAETRVSLQTRPIVLILHGVRVVSWSGLCLGGWEWESGWVDASRGESGDRLH